jgi:hypothetical protein
LNQKTILAPSIGFLAEDLRSKKKSSNSYCESCWQLPKEVEGRLEGLRCLVGLHDSSWICCFQCLDVFVCMYIIYISYSIINDYVPLCANIYIHTIQKYMLKTIAVIICSINV